MTPYTQMPKQELSVLLEELRGKFKELAAKELKLDLTRGRPSSAQLDLALPSLDVLNSSASYIAENDFDCRNYGILDGIPEAKRLMGELMDVPPENVVVGGNASLNLMHDCLSIAYIHGLVDSEKPWGKLDEVKILCPVPGYDRHWGIIEHFGFTMVNVPMTNEGPDMDLVEKLVADDESIKGIWIVPKYSNPQGITCSDKTVRRLANLKTAAKDFCIFYDNAYAVHELYPDEPQMLLPLLPELIKAGRPNMAIQFASTSKLTFPGAGISALAAGGTQIEYLKSHFNVQTIGYDKMNQLRAARFFKDLDGIKKHMRGHANILLPKFEAVDGVLEEELGGTDAATWTKPRGGYFISLDVMEGCASRALELCKEIGVAMNTAGNTFPYNKDPKDSNIRIAPSSPDIEQLKQAVHCLSLCIKIAVLEKLAE